MPDPKTAKEEADALPVEERDKDFYASKILYARKAAKPKEKKPKTMMEKIKKRLGLAELQAEAVEK